MKAEIWGPFAWIFLHSITLDYPDEPTVEDKKNIRDFFTLAGKVLPCDICRGHYQENLKKHPLTEQVLSSRFDLVKWLVDLHNEVNKATKKKVLSYKEAEDFLKKLNDGKIKFK